MAAMGEDILSDAVLREGFDSVMTHRVLRRNTLGQQRCTCYPAGESSHWQVRISIPRQDPPKVGQHTVAMHTQNTGTQCEGIVVHLCSQARFRIDQLNEKTVKQGTRPPRQHNRYHSLRQTLPLNACLRPWPGGPASANQYTIIVT